MMNNFSVFADKMNMENINIVIITVVSSAIKWKHVLMAHEVINEV